MPSATSASDTGQRHSQRKAEVRSFRAKHPICGKLSLSGPRDGDMAETLFLRALGSVDNLSALVELGHPLLDANKERAGYVTTGDARPGRETWVYGRAGRPCRRCGTPIRRGEAGPPGQERVRFWCPNCQR